MNPASPIAALLGLLIAPLLPGLVNRTQAVFGGRRGQPLLQAYWDIARLLRKGAVYSRTATWVLRAMPPVGLACAVTVLLVIPSGRVPACIAFPGDLVLVIGLLGLLRFLVALAALDTGSSFEGMGASREMLYAVLAEPAVLLALAALARLGGAFSLSALFAGLPPDAWAGSAPALALAVLALFIVCLAENSRIPFDDPHTHLELTMIHEVMVLDVSGPDFALVQYTAALKFWVFGSLLVSVVLSPFGLTGAAALAAQVGGLLALAVVTGIVASVMARLSLLKVPHLLVGANVFAALGCAFAMGMVL